MSKKVQNKRKGQKVMRNTDKIGQCLTLYEKGTHLGAIITPKEILDKPCLLYQNVLKNCL